MPPNRPDRMKPLLDCVQGNLGTTHEKGNALYAIVCAAIPLNLRDSIVFTRLKHRRLHLTVTSGAAANRLRFCQRALLEACAVLPNNPEHVSIRVAPAGTIKIEARPEIKPRYAKRPKPALGVQAAKNLRLAADDIEDKQLREALKRLASRTNGGGE